MSRKRIAIGCLGLLASALVALGVVAKPLLFPRQLDVVSIQSSAPYQDAALLERAWKLPVAATYMSSGLVFQENSSTCGPTSVANVIRSLGDPEATPSRTLEGSGKCPFGICWGGLTLDELLELARSKVRGQLRILRGLSIEEFREHLRLANTLDRRYIINFDRGPLFGRQGGHHSPIGGYLEQEDLVFVLDVNETFRPWLVSAERLHQAMNTVDGASGKQRGLLLIQPQP